MIHGSVAAVDRVPAVGLRVVDHPDVRRRVHGRVRAPAAAPARRDAGRAVASRMKQTRWPCSLVLLGLFASVRITLVSVEQEIAVGKQANAQVRKETPELTRRRDRPLRPRPDQTPRARGRRARSIRTASPLPTTARSTRSPCRAARSGFIAACSSTATNESQVASVLAHEIAHIASRHAARQLTTVAMTKWSLSLLGSLLGNSGGAGGAQVAAEFLASGVFLKFSRDEEREADRVGLALMTPRRVGRPRHGGDVRDPARRQSGRDPSSVEAFFSSHPSPQDRIKELSGRGGRASDGPA